MSKYGSTLTSPNEQDYGFLDARHVGLHTYPALKQNTATLVALPSLSAENRANID